MACALLFPAMQKGKVIYVPPRCLAAPAHRLSPPATGWLATAPAGGCRTVPQPRGQQRRRQVYVTWDFWGLCTQQANRWAERAIAEAFTAL